LKIYVKDLRPNPFRKLDLCSIDEEKVGRLIHSFHEMGFWNNVMARPMPDGTYELAYGYHRLLALQKTDIEEIDIYVREIDDFEMIQIMGAENREWYAKDSAVIIETVSVAKKHIEDHIAEKDAVYDNLDEWCQCLFFSKELFDRDCGGMSQGRHTIGRSIIESFLGKTWNRTTIAFALQVLEGETTVTQTTYISVPTIQETNDGENCIEPEVKKTTIQVNIPISREASELFSVVGQSRAFVETVTRDIHCRIAFPTEEMQLLIAKEIIANNEKITSSVIITQLQERAKEIVDQATHLASSIVPTLKMGNKSPKLVKEVEKIYKRLKQLPDFYRQNVLTTEMSQAVINNLYEMECFIQTYRIKMEGELSMPPNKDCTAYSNYPTCTDFSVVSIPDLLEVNTKEYKDLGIMTKDDEMWIASWLTREDVIAVNID